MDKLMYTNITDRDYMLKRKIVQIMKLQAENGRFGGDF